MMMVIENSCILFTSGLKKLDCITSKINQCNRKDCSLGCCCAMRIVNRYCTVTSEKSYSTTNKPIKVINRDSSSSINNGDSTSCGELFYTVINAVKSVVKCVSVIAISGNIERRDLEIHSRDTLNS